MKAVYMDSWSIKEKLCLASAVVQEGEHDWAAVSRMLQPFLEPHRPPDWFSERNCALQYNALLEKVEVPRRKKRSGPEKGESKIDSPGDIIKKKLTDERIEELKRLMQLDKEQYLKDKEEIILINCGYLDDQLPAMWAEIQEEKRQKEHEAKVHAQWLKEREERQKKQEAEQEWKPPVQSLQRRRKTQQAGRRRDSSQSSPGSEPDSTTVDSPLPELPKLDVLREEPSDSQPKSRVHTPVTLVTTPTPSSPLLTSLLKSPSPAPSSQASSILHSAITAQRGASPTIASLLSSTPGSVPPPPTTVSPSLKNLVSSAIATASEEHLKPPNTSPSAGAPTLSMLLELPPSLPGKPLPELPSVARQPAPPQLQQQQPPPPSIPPPPPPLLPPPQAHPSTIPGQEVSKTDQETVKKGGESDKTVKPSVEDLKKTVQCDELTDEAVLEMVLDTEDSVCTEPATVSVVSDAVDVKIQGSWVRALDFEEEVKKQRSEDDKGKLKKEDNGTVIMSTHELLTPKAEEETNTEKGVKDVPEMPAESAVRQENEEVIFEVINTENGKQDSGDVGIEVEVATKSEQDISENYAENASEQSGVNVGDITQEVFNIQEVEVPMSETVAEVVEIVGDESQNDLLAPELGDISEQQVLEVIVGPAPLVTSQELAVELPKKQFDDAKGPISDEKEKVTNEKLNEVTVSTDVSKKGQEISVGNEMSHQIGAAKTKHELSSVNNEVKHEVTKNRMDVETEERKKQSDKQKTEDKLRSKKKKHSKGKKKKHSREKRSDSKIRSKETDSKASEKKEETRSAQDEAKEKVKYDAKDGVKKRDNNSEKEMLKKETVKEEKKSNVKEVLLERVKNPKDGSKKVSESIQKDRNEKENGKHVENVSTVDKKKKESDKEISPSLKDTESLKDVLHSTKESSKKEKGTVLDKQHRGHHKVQDKNDDVFYKEEVLRKDKKEGIRRDSKDVTHKKSDKNSDSEGSGSLKEATPGSIAPTDEEDEKPLAEILDEKKLQLVSSILNKEEKPARSVEPQSGEEDKASDAEPSKVVSKKQRAAASTPIDSVPNSPAPSVTTDEEREHKAWKKAIMLLYNRLATHKYASLFLRPITNDLAPGYSSYIYKPVDLQMIKKNIEIGIIRTTTEFQKEVMRMFKNAIMYNKSLHDVHLMALEMQEECLQHIEEFVATQMLVASVGETPTRRETRTMDANKQKEFLRSPRPSSHDDMELIKPSKRKRHDTSSETPDHTPKRKTAED